MSAIFSALVFAMFEILLSILGFGMDRIGMKVDGKSGKKKRFPYDLETSFAVSDIQFCE